MNMDTTYVSMGQSWEVAIPEAVAVSMGPMMHCRVFVPGVWCKSWTFTHEPAGPLAPPSTGSSQ